MTAQKTALGALLAIAAAALIVGLALGARKAKPKAEATAPAAAPVATVGDLRIGLDELDRRAMAQDPTPYQQLYTARKAALDAMIEEHLVEQAAKARGVTSEQLFQQEVASKAAPVTEESVKGFYDANQARMGGRTFEQVQGQILQMLEGQAQGEARARFVKDLRASAQVSVSLEPPRVPVTIADNDPVTGPASAAVTIVTFSEFQCPYCARVRPALEQVQDTYRDKVRIVFRDYPLPFHPNAAKAAQAGQCANAQGKFWEYHDKLFDNQQALAVENLKTYATEMGLDAETFNRCLDSDQFQAAVQQDMEEGQKFGVRGTPAFFVNGRFLSGAQPFEAFAALIDEELQLAAAR